MKQNTNTLPTPELAILDTWVEGQPFQIRGDYEAVAEQLPRADEYVKHMAGSAAVAAVEAPRTAPRPEPEYLNLGSLDDRTAARLALKCFVRDMKNFGRTNKYRQFTEKRKAEQDLAFDMEVGLVDRVHCRLHERLLTKTDR